LVIAVRHDFEHLEETQGQLRQRSEELELATHAGGVGIWDADLVQGSVSCNDKLYELLGLTPRPGPESIDTFLGHIHPDDRHMIIADTASVTKAGLFVQELRIIRRDSQIRWLAVRGRVYHNADGRPVRMSGINYDITERKDTEQALARSRAELEAKLDELSRINAELNEYIYVVSHDLKAPLRAIHNYAHFLYEDLAHRLDDQCLAHLNGLKQAALKGDALIGDLLAFSRIGSSVIQHQPVAIFELVREVKMLLNPPASVVLDAANDFPILYTDATLLRRILENLMANALKFNTSDPKKIEIGWQAADDRYIEIFVRDNGIGIDPCYHAQIFRVFQRLHDENAYPGTGIGLAIVKKAANTLGGDVRVESRAGEGSVFFVRLPVRGELADEN
jgi:PAS domain S-box-containing protein